MQTKILNQYKLLKADIPNIIKNDIVEDVNVGGIKLKYEVSTIEALVFMFLGKQRIINLTKILNPRNPHKEVKVFLRPYKKVWGATRDKLPKNFWGSNKDPLTQHWVELEADYESLDKGSIYLKEEIRNTNITKHLSKNKSLFYVELKNQEKSNHSKN